MDITNPLNKWEPDEGDQLVSKKDAFLALHQFAQAFWERDGRGDDGLMRLVSFTSAGLARPGPSDPAMWYDWLAALKEVEGS